MSLNYLKFVERQEQTMSLLCLGRRNRFLSIELEDHLSILIYASSHVSLTIVEHVASLQWTVHDSCNAPTLQN